MGESKAGMAPISAGVASGMVVSLGPGVDWFPCNSDWPGRGSSGSTSLLLSLGPISGCLAATSEAEIPMASAWALRVGEDGGGEREVAGEDSG